MSEKRIVIIGASAAGISAVKEIRGLNREVPVLLLTDEMHLPYYRPLLTEFIGDDSAENKSAFSLVSREWLIENGVEFRLGERVTAIDIQRQCVTTERGGQYTFEKLIIAAGGVPFVPDPSALKKKNVFTIRTYDDARMVNLCSNTAKHAVVIGGGLLGLEAAYALTKRGISITIIEMADRILPRQLDPEGSTMLAGIIEDSGVRVLCGAKIQELRGEERVDSVLLESGELIPADMVIYSIGILANTALAIQCGLQVNRAVVVNQFMETSEPGIYACGDVAEFNGKSMALWVPAGKQGKVAGANAAGGRAEFQDEVYPAVLNAFGTRIYSIGDISKLAGISDFKDIGRINNEKKEYRKLFFADGRLTGIIMIGDIAEAQKLTAALKAGLTLEEAGR